MSRPWCCSASLVALLALATGCGGRADPRQRAVDAYVAKANAIEQRLATEVAEIKSAYRSFEAPALLKAHRQLAKAARTLDTLRDGVSRLQAPPVARGLQRDLLGVLTEQAAAARGLSAIADFLPRYRGVATSIGTAQRQLQIGLARAQTAYDQADTLSRYANACTASLAKLRPLEAPEGFERYVGARRAQLEAARASSRALAAALRQGRSQGDAAPVVARFEHDQQRALRIERMNPVAAARKAYMRHVNRAARFQLALARDRLRLERELS